MNNTTYKKIDEYTLEIASEEVVRTVCSYRNLIARRECLEVELASINKYMAKCDELGISSMDSIPRHSENPLL